MNWIILLLVLAGLLLISAVTQMPRKFYENELTRKLFQKRKRQEKKEEIFKINDEA